MSRLLSKEEIERVLTFQLPKEVSTGFVITAGMLSDLFKAQDAKTAKAKDREWVKWIENELAIQTIKGGLFINGVIAGKKWQAKKKEVMGE